MLSIAFAGYQSRKLKLQIVADPFMAELRKDKNLVKFIEVEMAKNLIALEVLRR